MRPLVLVAHGSRESAAGQVLESLRAAVGDRWQGTTTLAYLDHAAPDVPSALRAAGPGAVVVPLLLAEGFHSETDLPALVGAVTPGAPVASVLGPDDLLVAAVDRRLREAGERPGGCAVVLAAAGSSGPAAGPATEWTADRLARLGWQPAQPAYVSARAPAVPEAVAALRAEGHQRVVVASYLLAPGRFQDALAGAGADGVSAPLGAAPEVVELVLQRAREALAPSPHPHLRG